MIEIKSLVCSLLISTVISAQKLELKFENNKYGYLDKSGKIVIPFQYDDASNFKDGLAKVALNKKYGFIDITGKQVVPLKYDEAEDFENGYARVKAYGEGMKFKWGFVDKSGKEVIPIKYDEVRNFTEGLAAVKTNDSWGYIDITDKQIILSMYKYAYDFSEGLAAVAINFEFGFIDKSNNWIIPAKYTGVGSFRNGYAPVAIRQHPYKKWAYIDKTNKAITKFEYDYAYSLYDGKAQVEQNGKKFYLADELFMTKANLSQMEKVFDPQDGMQLVMDKATSKFGYLTLNDLVAIPLIYQSASFFGNGLAPVNFNGHKMYINKAGKEIINADKYIYTQIFYKGFAVVKNENKMYAFIDTLGNPATDFIYSQADGFRTGLAAVCKDGSCGYLGLDLKLAIPLLYKQADGFTESGLAHVITKQGKHGYIDKKGQFIINAIYDEASKDWNYYSTNPKWPYHTFQVKLAGKVKYLDASGKEVVPGDPDVEIKTQKHSLRIYQGWKDIFKNTERATSLISSENSGSLPSQIFGECSGYWLRTASTMNSINIRFDETESYTLNKSKQDFVDKAISRSGLAKDKIDIKEEQITMENGTKGQLLFSVCPDSKGMISGNYFDCEFSFLSMKKKGVLITYTIFIEGVPNLGPIERSTWMGYFKKVLLSIKPLKE